MMFYDKTIKNLQKYANYGFSYLLLYRIMVKLCKTSHLTNEKNGDNDEK